MKTPMSTRDEVELRHRQAAAAAAAPPRPFVEGLSLKPAPTPETQFGNTSFQPTDAGIVTPADLARALRDNNVELLTRARRLRGRRHPLSID